MKRYCTHNGLVAVVFLLLWFGLVLIEVKVGRYGFLKWIYAASLLLVFIGFFVSSWGALRGSSRHPVGFAVISSVLISPVFIFFGGALATNFKFMIGGHL